MFAKKLLQYGLSFVKGDCQEEDLTLPPLIFVFLVTCFPLRFVYELWDDPSDLRIVAMGLMIIGYAMIASFICGAWLWIFKMAKLPEDQFVRIVRLISRVQSMIMFPLGVVIFACGVMYR